MKTMLTLLILITAGISLFAQTEYESAMQETLTQFGNAHAVSDLNAVAAQFERIGEVETEEWLPSYYAGLIYCLLNYRTEDLEQKETYIQQAQAQLDKAMALVPEESEVYTLQGMVYQAMITLDPANNGQVYGAKSNGAFQTAIKLNASNPRPYYLQGITLLYTPEQYGGGKKAALPLLEKAMKLFNEVDAEENSLLPDWGKEDCEQNLKNCQEVQAAG